MKPTQFYVVVSLAAISLLLAITLVALGGANQRLQTELQKQQEEINRGSASQQVGTNLLRDMASISVKNDKMKEVLARNGYTVNVNPSPAPDSSAPATSPATSPAP